MGVTVGKYHLFKRSRKSGTFFYYWFQQGDGRIIKTCGRACTEKREAVAFLEDLLGTVSKYRQGDRKEVQKRREGQDEQG